MSEISQISDAYPSSLYGADAIDNLACLQSDDQQIFTPDLSYGQQSFNSVSDSDFLRPLLPLAPPVPSSLQCVSPDRKKTYVVYSNMTKNEFVAWWLKTNFGRKKKMRWDTKHQADVWNQFDQVANSTNGEPKVFCKKCAKVLDHPQTNKHGTSSMNKHIQGVQCRNSISRAGRKTDIMQFMQDAVSIIFFLIILY